MLAILRENLNICERKPDRNRKLNSPGRYGKKLTYLNLCGNISIVEKVLLANPYIAKRKFPVSALIGTLMRKPTNKQWRFRNSDFDSSLALASK